MSLTTLFLVFILSVTCWARIENFLHAATRTRRTAPFLHPVTVSSISRVEKTPTLASLLRLALTLEPCTATADCQAPRKCISDISDGELIPCAGETDCFCLADTPTFCNRSSTCDNGEVCIELTDDGDVCIAETVAEDRRFTPAQGAVSLEDCNSVSDCEGSRVCMTLIGSDLVACAGRDDCFCIPVTKLPGCSIPSDCDFGETCVRLEGGKDPVCASQAIAEQGSFKGISVETVKGRLTLEDCYKSKDCQNTDCTYLIDNSGDFTYCYGRDICGCLGDPPEYCTSNADCKVAGEICAEWQDFLAFCISKKVADNVSSVNPVESIEPSVPPPVPTAVPSTPVPSATSSTVPAPSVMLPGTTATSPSPSPSQSFIPSPSGIPSGTPVSEICIDAKALEQFETADLVYATHQRARVLCDENGSCATPGHMVLYKGESMMMKTYCTVMGCHERVMMVNSPRYKRRLVVDSKTSELVFTSFAARYGTRPEELVLSALVRLGF